MILRFIIILILFTSSVHAIELEKIPDGSILRGLFTQKRFLPDFETPLLSEGNFVVTSKGILWQTNKPFISTMVITQNGLKQYINNQKTMDITTTQIPFFKNLYFIINGMLAGNWDILKKDFNIKYIAGKENWRVKLTPHEQDNVAIPIKNINVTGEEFVDNVTMIRKDGGTDNLIFSHQKIFALSLSPQEELFFDSMSQ